MNNLLSAVRDTLFPQVSRETLAELDRINNDSVRTISVIGMVVECAGLLMMPFVYSDLPHAPQSLIFVMICICICTAALLISSEVKKRGAVSHTALTVYFFGVMILLIAWGMAVSYRHYADSEQIITFYTTVIIATCFPAVKPYAGISLIMLSFAAYFLILYGCDGAARIQPFNYFTFGVICAAGSVTRYHLTLRHLREKAEIDRLNASLRQDVQDMKYEVTKKELELSRTKIRLMQDQISPHFIFNALGIIKSLIWEDPRRAADSVNDFSVYLRRNIEALKSGDMILFHKELEHIEAFLAIEKADETVDLTVEYDIREADFPIPPLTVEPLVENAVIHGVSGYEHGARLSVSSRREDDCYIIEVRDNGRGFDAVKVTKGVGIDNVRTRLEVQCGGRLEIESSARGTTAVIYIPVRGEADENPGA